MNIQRGNLSVVLALIGLPAFSALGCSGELELGHEGPGGEDAQSASEGTNLTARDSLTDQVSAEATQDDKGLRAALIRATQEDAGARHDVRYDHAAAGEPAALWATAQGFESRFESDGVALRREGRTEDEASLALVQVGCASELAVVEPVEPVAVGNRVEFARNVGAVREWYLSGPLGLEQGFTLSEEPECSSATGEMVLVVDVEGLEPQLAEDGESVLLQTSDADGDQETSPPFRYGELYVVDATGREIPSSLAVVDGRIEIRIVTEGAVFPIEVDPLVAVAQTKISAGDATANDLFGFSVAISGDTALIGARFDDHSAIVDAGSAYVFVRSGSIWSLQQKLTASDAGTDDQFGSIVALAGETAVIGAQYEDNAAGVNAGSAYVFVRSGTTWTQQQKLTAGDGATTDEFGNSVAIAGDTIVVGAYQDDLAGATDAGSAYVFTRSGATWNLQQKLVASDGAADDQFGWVAISGDTVVVGAWVDDHAGGINAGGAYVFVRSGAAWSQQAKLVASDAAAQDFFGRSVSVSGDTAVVGSQYDDHSNHTDAGSGYVFVRSGASWVQQQKLIAPTPLSGDYFGWSVAVAGDLAIFGSPSRDLAAGTNAGAAYVFERVGTTWTPLTVIASDGAAEDQFSYSVALSGTTAIVGASTDDVAGASDAGSAYPFVLKRGDGDPCASAVECASNFCADGVCCNTACGGSNPSDCQACSTAAGAATNGTCGASTGNTCNDGNACFTTDVCQAGTCVGTTAVTCSALDDCHNVGTCNPATGICSNPEKVNGSVCNDSDECTTSDTCQSGACVGSAPLVCTASDDCHLPGECDPSTGVCSNPAKADGAACNDGNACTVDACQAGVCLGSDESPCVAMDECHEAGVCDPATGDCNNPAKPDGAPCTGGSCESGNCIPDEVGGGGGQPGTGGEGGSGAGSQGGAGTGASANVGGAGTGASANAGGAGGGDDGLEPSPDLGCDCRVVSPAEPPRTLGWMSALLASGLLMRRRRRAASRHN
jgi:MYXO-CTERM domain-containing protein